MVEIELKSIRLVNFMYCHDETFRFFKRTLVSGQNGKGKSTLGTAWMWLCFNTDMQLNSNPKVRREIDGKPVDDMDVAVEAVFTLDGVETTARKVQKRTYKKNGSGFSDDNSYFWNEVPATMEVFYSKFGIDMKVLQMCSNINSFLSKKDKEMREYLFGKIKDVSDLEIATKNSELFELVTLLRQYSTEEIEAMNKAAIARANKEIPVLKGQIKEKERDVTENSNMDFAELELFRNGMKERIAENQAKQDDVSRQYEEYQKLSDGILELKFKLSDLERKANEGNESRRQEIRSKIGELERKKLEIEQNIKDKQAEIERTETAVEKNTKLIYERAKEFDAAKEKLNAENQRVFDETKTFCPYCGQEYPEEKKDALRAEFESHKAEEIKRIEGEIKEIGEHGSSLRASITEDKKLIEQMKAWLKEHEGKLADVQNAIKAAEMEFEATPQSVDISGTDEYKAILEQISEKEQALEKFNSADDMRKTLKDEAANLQAQLLEAEKQIAKADVSADEERLEELRTNHSDLEQKKTDAQKILDLLDELDKAKNETLSDEVNSLFGLVKWKLFDYAKNGGYKSCCVPMIDKKSILTIETNTGNHFLGQLDIVNSIQKMEGIKVPVFVDNAESLDGENRKKAVEMMNCQVIALKVSDEKELNVEEI